jgi:hypothetical protein
MRQQLRLRVLVPVAVLGLLGAGFGAFAMGGPSEPESIPVQPATTAAVDTGATDTGATDTGSAPSPPPVPSAGEVDSAAWAQQANALCAQLSNDVEPLTHFESPKEAEESVTAILELLQRFQADLVAIGWPSGEKAAVLELHATFPAVIDFFEQIQSALDAGDIDQLVALTRPKPGVQAAAKEFDAELRRLGADTCAKNSPLDTASIRASGALQWQLQKYRVVVVVFYSPESDLDSAALAEARAAALDTNSGFVSVDVTDEKQVTAIAIGYEVAGSPTVLVIGRGPELRSEFSGIVDRETVAQAVTNARQ